MSKTAEQHAAKKALRFIDPRDDVVFKKIFGDQHHHDALIEFLNNVLELPTPIESVELIDPHQPPIIKELKGTILDIRARDGNGRQFIIEMQLQSETWFAQRVVYYSASAYAAQLSKGQNYSSLKPVIFLGVLNFSIFPNDDAPISRHLIMNKKTREHHLKDIEFNFIELPKFNKTEEQLQTLTDQWLFFLKNASTLQEIPKSVDSPVLRAAYQTAEGYGWSKEELALYNFWKMREHMQENVIKTAKMEGIKKGEEIGHKKGIEKGMQKGIEKGMEKGMLAKAGDIAKNLLQQGIDADSISKATELSVDEIANIKKMLDSDER